MQPIPWSFPAGEASTATSIGRSVEAAVVRCAGEWRTGGLRLDAFTTAENADDVAALIRALGRSEGQFDWHQLRHVPWLRESLRDHGALIDRAIFAGTEGPDHTVKLPLQTDAALERLSRHLADNAADKAGPRQPAGANPARFRAAGQGTGPGDPKTAGSVGMASTMPRSSLFS